MSEQASVWLRLLAALGALALGVAAVVIVAVLAHRTPGPAGATNTPAPSSTSSGETSKPVFPAPPDGAVVFSRPAGSDVLALAVVPGKDLGLQASVVSGQGDGVSGLDVSFRVDGRAAQAEACGAGCYRASVASPGAPKQVDVKVVRNGKITNWRVPMPRQWPPRDASAIVKRATKTYRALRSFAIDDSLASSPGRAVLTHWTLVAPDRLSYQIKNGAAAVIIGDRRWDKLPGGKWTTSAQTPIHQPTPFWVSWTDAHVLANTKSGWRVSFFDPKTPGWFELRIAKKSMRTLELRMHTTAHFMHELYSQFNAPLEVNPPQ